MAETFESIIREVTKDFDLGERSRLKNGGAIADVQRNMPHGWEDKDAAEMRELKIAIRGIFVKWLLRH